MKWLLIVYLAGMRTEAVTTVKFSDLRSCRSAGVEIMRFVGDNDGQLGAKPMGNFTCIRVSGAS